MKYVCLFLASFFATIVWYAIETMIGDHMPLTQLLVKAARLLRDVRAVRRGRIARRIENRVIGRIAGKLLRKLWR